MKLKDPVSVMKEVGITDDDTPAQLVFLAYVSGYMQGCFSLQPTVSNREMDLLLNEAVTRAAEHLREISEAEDLESE